MQLSILLLTFNEAENLPRCLGALSWCDDILVLDSGSTDGTQAIAERFGARIMVRAFDNFAGQRNAGLESGAFRHEWVLHLDADELVTPEFQAALAQLQPENGVDAYNVPSKLMLNDRWLRYAGMYPTYQVRLGHRDRLRFVQVGHGQREDLPPARIGTFAEPYLHYNFSHGIAAWLRKHVRYAEDEAALIVAIRGGKQAAAPTETGGPTERRRWLKTMAARLPLLLRPVMRFFYIYVWRRGFLDGRSGALYALMLSVYDGMIAVLAAEQFSRQRGLSEASPPAGIGLLALANQTAYGNAGNDGPSQLAAFRGHEHRRDAIRGTREDAADTGNG